MAFSDQQLEELKERADLVTIVGRRLALRKVGKDFVGLCPFHGERSPSFYVVPNKHLWHCFGCGESGDIFKFFMKLDGMGFMDAVKHTAAESGFLLTEEKLDGEEAKRRAHLDELAGLMERAVRFYEQRLWHDSGKPIQEYLRKRGVSEEFARKFRLGFGGTGMDPLSKALSKAGANAALAAEAGLCISSPRNGRLFDRFHGRLISPIRVPRPPDGRSIALGGRYMEGLPETRGRQPDRKPAKYINSPESPLYQKGHVLFGLDLARDSIRREERAVIVEGYFDVIGVHQAGLPLAVATCGTSLTPNHLDLLTRSSAKEIIFLFDGDAAGLRAAARAAQMCAKAQIPAKVATLPDGQDPDDFARQRGLDGLKGLLDRAKPVIELLIDAALNELGPNAGVEERVRAVESVREIVLAAPSGLAQELYAAQIAERLRVSDTAIRQALFRQARGEKAARESSMDPELQTLASATASMVDDLLRPLPASRRVPVTSVQTIARQTIEFERFITISLLKYPALAEIVLQSGITADFGNPVFRATAERVLAAVQASETIDAPHLIAEIPDGGERATFMQVLATEDVTLEMTRHLLNAVITKMRKKVRQAQARAAWLAARQRAQAASNATG